jgi:hypothetical protein
MMVSDDLRADCVVIALSGRAVGPRAWSPSVVRRVRNGRGPGGARLSIGLDLRGDADRQCPTARARTQCPPLDSHVPAAPHDLSPTRGGEQLPQARSDDDQILSGRSVSICVGRWPNCLDSIRVFSSSRETAVHTPGRSLTSTRPSSLSPPDTSARGRRSAHVSLQLTTCRCPVEGVPAVEPSRHQMGPRWADCHTAGGSL